MLKRAIQELERAVEELPSFGQHLRTARASYLLLRGKPREAIPLLQHYSEPLAVVGWTRCRGRLASAHNALGEFTEAKSICEDALARLSPEDLMFTAMNLIVELELCIAETGLGNAARATAYLDRLLETHAPFKGPLTLGAIHDAYAQVAIMEKDFALAAVHLEQMEGLYRPLDVPSLTARMEALTRRAQAAQRADLSQPEGLLLSDDVHLITRVQLLLTHSGEVASERADKALQIAVELSGADDGFIVLQRMTGKVSAFLNQEPPEELVGWAHARLLAAYANDETAAVEDVNSLIDLNLKQLDGVRYCTAPLWARVGHEDIVVAVVALGFRNSSPKLPGADVLRVIASSLVDVARISDRPQRHGTESTS
jgi:tetratricopeptide (TPR) repeat protein